MIFLMRELCKKNWFLCERYESNISSLQETKDLSSISLVELVNALQAQEQRRMMRGEASIEGALYVKEKNPGGGNNNRENDIFPPFPHYKKINHPQIRCWWRHDVKCRKCCNLGHVERVCRSKSDEAKISMEQQEEGLLFVTKCFAISNSSCDSWLIDSGCATHTTNDHKLLTKSLFPK